LHSPGKFKSKIHFNYNVLFHKKNQNRCHQTRFTGSKCVCGQGSALELAEGAYSTHSPDPLAGFKGPLRSGEKGQSGEARREREEKRGKKGLRE